MIEKRYSLSYELHCILILHPSLDQRQSHQDWSPDTARDGETKRVKDERERERKSGRGGREKTQRERKEKRVKDERGREKRIDRKSTRLNSSHL